MTHSLGHRLLLRDHPHVRSLVCVLVGALCLYVSGQLVWQHATALVLARESALPLAASIPPLQERSNILKQEIELAQLQSAMHNGSEAERIRTFILPADQSIERIIALLDALRTSFQKQSLLKNMSAIDIKASNADTPAFAATAQHVSFSATLTADGVRQFEQAVRVSGLLTVADALTKEQITEMLHMLESQSPADLAAFEQLLHTDLLLYAQDPATVERRFLEAVSADDVTRVFTTMKNESLLPIAVTIYGSPLGTVLRDTALWPTPFLSVEHMHLTTLADGNVRAEFVLAAYTRTENAK